MLLLLMFLFLVDLMSFKILLQIISGKMEKDISQLVCTNRDPLLSSSNVADSVTNQLSQSTSSPAYFSTPLNSPLLLSPSTSFWSPVSLPSPTFLARDGTTRKTIELVEDFQVS